METSLVIFLIWMSIAVIGIIAKARKKARESADAAPYHRTPNLDEILEHIQQPQVKENQPKATKKRFTPADEGIASTTPQDNPSAAKAKKDASAVKKDGKMEFDPVDMIIYSEIMKPGYEKY